MTYKKILITYNKIILPLLILSLIFLMYFVNTKKVDDVVVFVLDSRVNSDVVKGKPILYETDITHGSIVTRLINKEAPTARIIPLTVETRSSLSQEIYKSGLRKVMLYKKHKPDHRVLVNVSLAFAKYEQEHYQLIKNLRQMGVIVIGAAGNDSSDKPVYPAGFENCVAVASATREGKASHSNYGQYIDISASGELTDTFHLYYAGGLKYSRLKTDGTSLAAPRITGLLARILTIKSDWQPEDALELIIKTAHRINDYYYREGQLGAGVIDKNTVLKRIDPLYYFKQPGFIIILIFVLLLLHLWPVHGPVSVFFALLTLFSGLPVILLLEELWFQLRKGSIQLKTFGIIISAVIVIIAAPYLVRHRKRHKLKRYLKEIDELQINQLLTMALNNSNFKKIIVDFLKKEEGIETELINNITRKNSIEEKRVAADILISLNYNKKVVDKLIALLEPDNENAYSVKSRLIILEILYEHGKEAQNAVQVVKQIIKKKQNEMWLRYQATRTLVAIHPQPLKLLPFLTNLSRDDQELVRIEARGLIDDISSKRD